MSPVFRPSRLAGFAAWAACVLLSAAPAGGMQILAEQGFNGDGMGLAYTVVGGGVSPSTPDDFWGLASIAGPLGFTGSEGADFFAGRDLNGNIDTNGDGIGDGDLNPRVLSTSAVDVSAFVGDTALRILIAGFPGEWEAVPDDFIRIFAVDDDTGTRQLLDEFLSNSPGNGDLQSQVTGTVLGIAFQSFDYDLPVTMDRVRVDIEVHSTGNLESMGFDLLQILRKSPEPSTGLLLYGGLLALSVGRRQRPRRETPRSA